MSKSRLALASKPDGLLAARADCWRNIAISLIIDPARWGFERYGLISTVGTKVGHSGVCVSVEPSPMRRILTIVLSLLFLGTFGHPQNSDEWFLGTWEIRKSPTTGRVNLTVKIVQESNTISGTVRVINPNGTTTEWPIAQPEFKGTTTTESLIFRAEFKGPTLAFQTLDHDAIMHWSLTLTNARSGLLRGDEGELLIEEKVKKKR